jgi:hypothetical protein
VLGAALLGLVVVAIVAYAVAARPTGAYGAVENGLSNFKNASMLTIQPIAEGEGNCNKPCGPVELKQSGGNGSVPLNGQGNGSSTCGSIPQCAAGIFSNLPSNANDYTSSDQQNGILYVDVSLGATCSGGSWCATRIGIDSHTNNIVCYDVWASGGSHSTWTGYLISGYVDSSGNQTDTSTGISNGNC